MPPYFGPGSTGATTPVHSSGAVDSTGKPYFGSGRSSGWDWSTNRPSPLVWDESSAVGGGGAGLFGPAAGAPDWQQQAQQRAFGTLGEGASIFRGGLGQAVGAGLQGRVSGADAPYGQALQDRMFASAADQSAASGAAREQQIREHFANSGLGGSGAQLGQMLDVGGQHAAIMQGARSEIQNAAATQNFGARERAANDASGFMGTQSAAEAPYRIKEADLLSQMNATSQGQDPAMAALLRALGGGTGSGRMGPGMGPTLGPTPQGGGGYYGAGGSPNPYVGGQNMPWNDPGAVGDPSGFFSRQQQQQGPAGRGGLFQPGVQWQSPRPPTPYERSLGMGPGAGGGYTGGF